MIVKGFIPKMSSAAKRVRRPWRAPIVAVLALPLAIGECDSDTCNYRGDLDKGYCDENHDLLADPPKDPTRWKNPQLLLFTYSPLEDPAVYEKTFEDFLTYMATCTGKQIHFYSVLSSAAAIEAMRAGRMHLGTFSTGDTPFAVNLAGAIPFAMRGNESGPEVYQLVTVVRTSSPYEKVSDLKGRKVAHVSPSSNSGNLAARALLPDAGLVPDIDYKVLYSGKHENSVIGVTTGDYDAAHVASGILSRMQTLGQIKAGELRVIFRSPDFPAGSLVMAHDLAPALQKRIRECTFDYRYSPEMVAAFQGADRWWPIDYKRDWESVRKVAATNGEHFDRKALDAKHEKAPE
jgi:phosphonate transport system substrate-binding protein